jgi:hypothetical protein
VISPVVEDASRSPAGRDGWQEAGRAARPVSRVTVASRRRNVPYLPVGVLLVWPAGTMRLPPDVLAQFATLVAAGSTGAHSGPEPARLGEVPAEGVPGHAGMLGPQRGQASTGQPAALVVLNRVGLFHPPQSAASADLIVDGDDLLAVQVRRMLPPTRPLRRYGVLPRGAEDRHDLPARWAWSTGDGDTVTCGEGAAWTPGADPRAASPDCGHVYSDPSGTVSGGKHAVAATITWQVTWSGGGATGTEPALTSTASVQVAVVESAAVNTSW